MKFLNRVKDDLKNFTYDSALKFETAEELPPDLLAAFKDILPMKKFTPLLSNNEWIESLRVSKMKSNVAGQNKFNSKDFKRHRIFKDAYRYKNYFIIDYYFTGRYRIERRAVVLWTDNKIEAVLLIHRDDLTDSSNFNLKKYNKKIYVGQLIVDPDIW